MIMNVTPELEEILLVQPSILIHLAKSRGLPSILPPEILSLQMQVAIAFEAYLQRMAQSLLSLAME